MLNVGPMEIVCPTCTAELQDGINSVVCASGHSFARSGATVDFLGGQEAADADLEISMDHAGEAAAAPWRVSKYLVPHLDRLIGGTQGRTVLDDGCGIGAVVAELLGCGVEAYGIDPGTRAGQWADSKAAERLMRADGARLPFPDASFDAVISSGVLEHLGEPAPWPERRPVQVGYIREALRVLKPGGVAIMAAPNGAHPVDYWHGRRLESFETTTSPMRVHVPYERWMPNSFRLRDWVASADCPAEVSFLTPEDFLAFERIQKHWAGRAFTSSMKSIFRLITRHPALASSPINPWLVVCIRRG